MFRNVLFSEWFARTQTHVCCERQDPPIVPGVVVLHAYFWSAFVVQRARSSLQDLQTILCHQPFTPTMNGDNVICKFQIQDFRTTQANSSRALISNSISKCLGRQAPTDRQHTTAAISQHLSDQTSENPATYGTLGMTCTPLLIGGGELVH